MGNSWSRRFIEERFRAVPYCHGDTFERLWQDWVQTIFETIVHRVRDRLVALAPGRHYHWYDAAAWVNAHKAFTGCLFCGERDPSCLDLHHRDRSTKTKAISVIVANDGGRAAAILESRKCDVVCANCHRKTHHCERFSLPTMERRRG